MPFESFKTLFFQIKIHYNKNKIFNEADAIFKIRYLPSIPFSFNEMLNILS